MSTYSQNQNIIVFLKKLFGEDSNIEIFVKKDGVRILHILEINQNHIDAIQMKFPNSQLYIKESTESNTGFLCYVQYNRQTATIKNCIYFFIIVLILFFLLLYNLYTNYSHFFVETKYDESFDSGKLSP